MLQRFDSFPTFFEELSNFERFWRSFDFCSKTVLKWSLFRKLNLNIFNCLQISQNSFKNFQKPSNSCHFPTNLTHNRNIKSSIQKTQFQIKISSYEISLTQLMHRPQLYWFFDRFCFFVFSNKIVSPFLFAVQTLFQSILTAFTKNFLFMLEKCHKMS